MSSVVILNLLVYSVQLLVFFMFGVDLLSSSYVIIEFRKSWVVRESFGLGHSLNWNHVNPATATSLEIIYTLLRGS